MLDMYSIAIESAFKIHRISVIFISYQLNTTKMKKKKISPSQHNIEFGNTWYHVGLN